MTTIFPSTRVHSICLRYGWKLPNTPTKFSCGTAFSTDHAIICPKVGFPTIRHNELRDVTASLLSEVCHNVATEPRLQPLSGESLTHRTAITSDDARLDIRARGFWSAAQDAYFDVRVFHPNAPSNRSGSLSSAYKKHEDSKKRAYGQRVRDVESLHLSFSPPLGGWDGKPQPSTKGWRTCSPGNNRRHTPLLSVG